jgi:hypothetical protein
MGMSKITVIIALSCLERAMDLGQSIGRDGHDVPFGAEFVLQPFHYPPLLVGLDEDYKPVRRMCKPFHEDIPLVIKAD